jgi:hypothetical protein
MYMVTYRLGFGMSIPRVRKFELIPIPANNAHVAGTSTHCTQFHAVSYETRGTNGTCGFICFCPPWKLMKLVHMSIDMCHSLREVVDLGVKLLLLCPLVPVPTTLPSFISVHPHLSALALIHAIPTLSLCLCWHLIVCAHPCSCSLLSMYCKSIIDTLLLHFVLILLCFPLVLWVTVHGCAMSWCAESQYHTISVILVTWSHGFSCTQPYMI